MTRKLLLYNCSIGESKVRNGQGPTRQGIVVIWLLIAFNGVGSNEITPCSHRRINDLNNCASMSYHVAGLLLKKNIEVGALVDVQ